MPAPTVVPRPLATWLQELEPKQPPVNDAVRSAALKALAAGGSASAVATLVLNDPALVLLLFREANQALARYDRETHTLEHAISLLGASRVQALVANAPVLDNNHPHAQAYRLKLLRSRHAAAQARLWAEGTGLWPAEEVFWATLLATAPLWLLRLEAGDALHQIDLFRAEHGAVGKKQVFALFGCDTFVLSGQLAERWRLPKISQLGWQHGAVGTRRQWIELYRSAHQDEAPTIPTRALTELCHHPALVVALANTLATEADWDWSSRRCQRLLNIAATVCRRPVATLVAYVHQTAAAVSREQIDPDLPTPGAKLLGHWQQARCWFKEKPKPAPVVSEPVPLSATPSATEALAEPRPAVAPGPSPADRTLAACVQQLRNPAALSGVREALEIGLKALHEGISCRRVAVLLAKPGSRELQTVLSAGAEHSPALRQFRLATQTSQLFTQLLAKPVCLLVDADNRAKYWPHVPESFRTAIDCDNFALMSVFAGERPVALIYADNAGAAFVSGSRQHTLFKQLCQQLSQTLAQLR